ncbi:MAG TPA: sugar ABC transporter permease [Lachnospiraceae bacterium]|mgnify:FL=1|nr:carbohydrate ABC transporter permease [Lachnospiraceae bacterium]MDD7665072.1 carbohydrate ABC transporter permease [Lachnospiraceae bacterium]MDY4165505.1 carbohydrate ABC transporter permease [Lachnospiraceae bacterium]HAP03908.1 sugar ABC transporter permease [Lachnospiraceae bacterium]
MDNSDSKLKLEDLGAPKKSAASVTVRRVIAYVVLILLTILCLIWFYILFINATRSNGDLSRGFRAYPSDRLLVNLNNIFHGSLPVVRGMINSLIVAGCTALLTTYFSTMTAYAIHAFRFKGRKAIFVFILAIMMIPTQVSALGFQQLCYSWGLENSFIPLIVPSIASAVVFFYMKQYMDSNLPHELLEAARIDGAGEIRIFNTIVIPLMKPAIAVQAIFAFVGSWNNYFIPSLLLHKDEMKTLPILIAQLRAADYLKFDMGQVYAMIAFSIFPVIIVYLLLSRYIVGGVTAGSVKG